MTVVVLAPHPDDETIGCGGMLRLTADRHERTVVVFLTSGEAGVRGLPLEKARQVREDEAEHAAQVLGVARTVFLRGSDWSLAQDAPRLLPAVEAVLLDELPDLVVSPHPGDAHQDHSAAADLVLAAIPAGLAPDLAMYEVWTPMSFFHEVVDISSVMDDKVAALRCYCSQVSQMRYDRAVKGLAAYRGALAGGCEFAEVLQYAELPARPKAWT